MPFNDHRYQQCKEDDVSEHEIVELETGKYQLFEEPKDSYYLVYVTFCIIGITSLLPAYFFTVANQYWMYKFRNATNETGTLNRLQVSYTAYANLASAIPLPICCIINVLINEKFSCRKRIIGSLITMLIFFLLTLVLVEIDTSSWQNGFLVLTLSTIAILSAASGILLSTASGITNKFSSKYITSFSLGRGISGTFSSLAEVVSLAVGASPTLNGLIYFVIGCFTIITALVTYVVLEKNTYFQYFMYKKNEIGLNGSENILIDSPGISYKLIFKKIWHYILCAFIVLFVTLSINPGVCVLIKSYGTGIWSDRYFLPVITFLLPNLLDCVGRVVAVFTDWPKDRNVLISLNIIRISIIPLILFCNVQPRGQLPVIFNNDAYYIVLMIIGGFTNGYLVNTAIINIPRVVEHHEKYSAGLIGGIFLTSAVSFGALLSVLIVKSL